MRRAVILLGLLALAPCVNGQTTANHEATGSGHEIHLFQPARAIEGITRAVSAVRTRAPLSGQ